MKVRVIKTVLSILIDVISVILPFLNKSERSDNEKVLRNSANDGEKNSSTEE